MTRPRLRAESPSPERLLVGGVAPGGEGKRRSAVARALAWPASCWAVVRSGPAILPMMARPRRDAVGDHAPADLEERRRVRIADRAEVGPVVAADELPAVAGDVVVGRAHVPGLRCRNM